MSRRLAQKLASALLALALLGGAGAAHAGPRGLEGAPESFEKWIEGLPEGQRRTALRRLGDMPTHRRNRLFHRWEALEEGERRAFQERMTQRFERRAAARERFERMSPEQREQLAPLVRRWRGMGPEERRRMRERLARFRELAPEAQQALIDRKFAAKSPEERARILDSLREASRALPERPLPGTPEAPPPPD